MKTESQLNKNDPRCLGIECSEKHDCKRWIYREEPAHRINPTMNSTKEAKCFYKIKN